MITYFVCDLLVAAKIRMMVVERRTSLLMCGHLVKVLYAMYMQLDLT